MATSSTFRLFDPAPGLRGWWRKRKVRKLRLRKIEAMEALRFAHAKALIKEIERLTGRPELTWEQS